MYVLYLGIDRKSGILAICAHAQCSKYIIIMKNLNICLMKYICSVTEQNMVFENFPIEMHGGLVRGRV